jgi:hypothetical protein
VSHRTGGVCSTLVTVENARAICQADGKESGSHLCKAPPHE